MNGINRREELADFLRTRRARLSPEQLGLPSGCRRRTPGLRREEVAELAEIGASWYTWLEQGRDINVSVQVLENIARALQLNADERVYLFMLTHQQLPPTPPPPQEIISPAMQEILDSFEFHPAYIVGHNEDVLAWNKAACAVFTDFSAVSERERNFVWLTFTDKQLREHTIDWEGFAQCVIAQFRADCGHYLEDDPRSQVLIEDLQRVSPEFRQWWARHDVLRKVQYVNRFNHPVVGYLALKYTGFRVEDAPDLRLAVFTPLAEANTAQKLQQLLNTSTHDVTTNPLIP